MTTQPTTEQQPGLGTLLVYSRETEGLCREEFLQKFAPHSASAPGPGAEALLLALDNLIEAKMVRFRVEMLLRGKVP